MPSKKMRLLLVVLSTLAAASRPPGQTLPQLLPFVRTGDVYVSDSSGDTIWRFQDLDLDGTFNGANELVVFYDDVAGPLPINTNNGIAGGPDGTEDDNWTIYDYRVHNRTHHAWFYKRTDDMVAAALAGGGEQVVVDDALVAPDESMVVRVMDDTFTDVELAWGDGETDTGGPMFEHSYAAPETYMLSLTATSEGADFTWEAPVAALSEEHATGFTAPEGVDIIEPVMPGLVFGPIDDARGAVGFALVPENTVRPQLWYEITRTSGSTMLFESDPARLVVPVVNQSTGDVQTSIVVEDATLV